MDFRLVHRTFGLGIIIALFALIAAAAPVLAQNSIEKLLMPGPLIAGHAKLEDDCNNCHKPFSKESQDSLCLDCHKPVRADITAKTGFHGRNREVKAYSCSLCHADHKGRDAAIATVDRALFDHGQTDYPLTGAHAGVRCEGCHAAGKPWRDAPNTCFACHTADDPHKGNLGKECQQCHEIANWRQPKPFDHDKTKFKLTGGHAKVACLSCHLGEIYRGLPAGCNDCHAAQDVHVRRFGTDCAACHVEKSWKEAKFDHGKLTHFPLRGAHAKADCRSCHGDSILKKLAMACADCHQKQDVHKAKLGKACGDCHGETAWRKDVKFDHGMTDFPLIGLHVPVACEACHVSAEFRGAPSLCKDCHGADDVHAGRLTAKCESCHSANGWARVNFDHGRQTKFALTGAHRKAGCYSCHQAKNVQDASLPTDCFSCHRKQDVHRGAYGKNCARCHSTSTFKTAIIRP